VDGDAFVFEAWGLGDTGSDVKTLRVYWAGVQLAAITGTASPSGTFPDWKVSGSIVRSGATSKVVTLNVEPGQALSTSILVTTGTATLSSTNIFKVTGQGASSNQLVLKYGRLQFQAHS